MSHPYEKLPPQAFWRSGVAEADPKAITNLGPPKFRLTPADGIATAGSCFAQHVGRALREAGLAVLDAETPPAGMATDTARRFGYGLFSGRYGNIYTVRQLVQLLQDVVDDAVDPADVWQRDGRFYDALRPGVEPDGLSSPEEVMAMRRVHLRRVGGMLAEASVFVFTLGLTEAWVDRHRGRVFPSCPGVIAGQFDPAHHTFVNFRFAEILVDLARARNLLKQIQPDMRIILTVSPVPMTATVSGAHVLSATGYSKSVLRAAVGEFAEDHPDVDYFPSYEIITNPAARGRWYDKNARSVTSEGVGAVMAAFLATHQLTDRTPPTPEKPGPGGPTTDDLICEDILLEAFRP